MAREFGFALGAGLLGLTFAAVPDAAAPAGLVLAIAFAFAATGVNAARVWITRR